MYVVNMKMTRVYAQGEYCFNTKAETQKFLESLNNYELDNIESIEKYNKNNYRNAYYDFFN